MPAMSSQPGTSRGRAARGRERERTLAGRKPACEAQELNKILTGRRPCSPTSGWPTPPTLGEAMRTQDRQSFGRSAMLRVSLLASSAMSGRADETFVCEDGSSVTIDDDNRAAMQE